VGLRQRSALSDTITPNYVESTNQEFAVGTFGTTGANSGVVSYDNHETARSQDLACREQCACRAGAVAQGKFVIEEGNALRGSVPALVAVMAF
jgi:hypothetical protein